MLMKHRTYILTLLFTGLASLTFGQDLFPYRQGILWGFCDSTKKIAITPKYQSADIFSRCNIATVKLNDKYGFINKEGKEITEIKYDRWSFFWYSHTYVWLNNKVGVIDTNGNVIIPIIYDNISFTNKIIGVKQNEKWGFYTFNGEEIREPTYQEIKIRSYHLTAVKLNDNWGFIDSTGKMKVKPKFEDVKGFSKQGLCAVKQKDKWGFINFKGKIKIKPIYEDVNGFQEQGCWVKQNSKWGLINKKGEIIIPFDYDEVSYFKEDLAFVQKNNKYGFIDKNGKTIIPFNFYQAFEFREGLAEVCYSEDSCGYINKDGIVVIPFQYRVNFGGEFNEGLAEVRIGDKYGFINSKGVVIVPVNYDSPYDYNSFDDGVGMLLIPKNDNMTDFNNRKFYFNKNGTLFFDD